MLCSFAIAQPLLDITGRSPETFVFYRVDGLKVVAYALLIVVVPPVAAVARWSPAISPRCPAAAGRVAYVVVAGALIALTVLQAGKKVSDLRGPALVVARGRSSPAARCGCSRAARPRRAS